VVVEQLKCGGRGGENIGIVVVDEVELKTIKLWWCWRRRKEIKIVEDRNIIVEVEEAK